MLDILLLMATNLYHSKTLHLWCLLYYSQISKYLTGGDWGSGRETEQCVVEGGDILLPKPATPQPSSGKADRRKEGRTKREQEEEERERMQ